MIDKAEKILQCKGEVYQSAMQYRRLEIDARRNWDTYYKSNTTNGYKDRNYIHEEFDEL